jgi:hypothetical protein
MLCYVLMKQVFYIASDIAAWIVVYSVNASVTFH